MKSTNDITVSVHSKISVITVTNYDLLLDGNSKSNGLSTDTSFGFQPDFPQNNNRPTLLYNNTINAESEENRTKTAENQVSDAEVISVVSKYNEICRSLPDIQTNIAIRHRAELIGKAKAVMENATFEQLFTLVEKSDFLTRRKADSGFRADFEWIMKPDNIKKILSGAYTENYSKTEKKEMPSAADYNASLYD